MIQGSGFRYITLRISPDEGSLLVQGSGDSRRSRLPFVPLHSDMDPNSSPTNAQATDHTKKEPIGDKEDEWDTHSVTKSYYRMTALQAQEYVKGLRDKNASVQLEKLEDDETVMTEREECWAVRARITVAPRR